MTIFAKKSISRWSIFFTFLAVTVFLFSSCGKLGRSASGELSIGLTIPEGESPDLFWYGVQNKTLRVEKEGEEAITINWQENTRIPVDINEGDLLHFQATDRNSRVVVEGKVTVGQEKDITIPVHRVL